MPVSHSRHFLSLSVSVHFKWPFSRWTWVSWCLLKQRMMDVVMITGAISRAKLQSNHHHQQTNIQFLRARCPSCRRTNIVKALKGNISHSMDLLTPSSSGVFQLCLWALWQKCAHLVIILEWRWFCWYSCEEEEDCRWHTGCFKVSF